MDEGETPTTDKGHLTKPGEFIADVAGQTLISVILEWLLHFLPF